MVNSVRLRETRSAKREDIESSGSFTGCFSYNSNTEPSPIQLPPERRVYVCDFSNPDDTFRDSLSNVGGSFLVDEWQQKLLLRVN